MVICQEKNVYNRYVYLLYTYYDNFNNTYGRVYRALLSDCRRCSRREKCLRSENTRQRSLYVIEKYFNRNYSEEMKAKIDTPEGREIYSRRMGIIEPVFANVTNAKGLNRFTLRTGKKVNTQWLLYCMVHNIDKVCRYG
ncbi:MAG: transposase [Spirochaetota bacterium]